jgi:hypothetical protein
MNQNQRLDAMAKLKQFHCRVLISTDLVKLLLGLGDCWSWHVLLSDCCPVSCRYLTGTRDKSYLSSSGKSAFLKICLMFNICFEIGLVLVTH